MKKLKRKKNRKRKKSSQRLAKPTSGSPKDPLLLSRKPFRAIPTNSSSGESVLKPGVLTFFDRLESPENSSTNCEHPSCIGQIFSRRALAFLLTILFFSLLINAEFHYGYIQSNFFSKLASKARFKLEEGEGTPLQSPQGPFDKRYGYARATDFRKSLLAHGFSQTHHTEVSDTVKSLSENGINIPYREKTQSGIQIFDKTGKTMYRFLEPTWKFSRFEEIAPLIVKTLLFIENKTLLDSGSPYANPAIEWSRFLKASVDLVAKKITGRGEVPGGSTLATQIEKYKHSDGGLTLVPTDKLKQMFSSSLRAYAEGADTTKARGEIALDYINTVPLAALPGYGEIHGLGDGLWAYYADNPLEVNALLLKTDIELDKIELRQKASAYRKVLSLFLAHRRPSDYLDDDPTDLQHQVDRYLPLLFREGIISYRLYQLALEEKALHRRTLPASDPIPFTRRKGPNVVRSRLLSDMSVSSLYELDRLDMRTSSTLNIDAQESVSRILLELTTPEGIKKHKLDGYRMLDPKADPAKVIFSMTLFEKLGDRNELRIQTDTFNQPFNINEGVKLDLGSTAKFRMLVTYLQAIEKTYFKFIHMSESQRKLLAKSRLDILSTWTLNYINSNPQSNITEVLDSALERRYSANPRERFFTGSGMHTFSNFNHKFDSASVTLKEALRHSINLPFIRLTRDLVTHYGYITEGSTLRSIDSMKDLTRMNYLSRFADQEGKIFIRRFYSKYQNLKPNKILEKLLDSVRHDPKRFAGIFWFLNPEANVEEFITFMKLHVDHAALSEERLSQYFDRYSKLKDSLADQGYVARMHPLELWTAAYLVNNPGATLSDLFRDGKKQRIEVYEWLMKTSRKKAQDKRIKIILEAEAFEQIHEAWEKLGYPLPSLVPSYATALGTSADRPDALATLMGIILNDGVNYDKTMISDVILAEETPYEMRFAKKVKQPKRVLSKAVASAARARLFDVVAEGTARRLRTGIKIGENTYHVGGKTGTGDHRYQIFSAGGRLVSERVVNRTATFMFILGDRYFGVLSAFVPGQDAAKYHFTSALPVQVLKVLEPAFENLSKTPKELP